MARFILYKLQKKSQINKLQFIDRVEVLLISGYVIIFIDGQKILNQINSKIKRHRHTLFRQLIVFIDWLIKYWQRLLALIIIGLAVYPFFSPRLFQIEPIALPVSLTKSGNTTEFITKNSYAKVSKIREAFLKNDTKFINTIKTNNNFKDLNCHNLNLVTNGLDITQDLLRVIALRDVNNKNDITFNFGVVQISWNVYRNFIKQLKDKPTIIISGNVVDELNGKYAIKIVTNFDTSIPHASELTANNIAEIEDKISILLLKYTYPAIYASLVSSANNTESIDTLNMAMQNLAEYKQNPAALTVLGNLYLENVVSAYDINSVKEAINQYEKALRSDKNYQAAKIGLAKANYAYVGFSDKLSLKEKDQKYVEMSKLIDTVITSNTYLNDAYTLKIKLAYLDEVNAIAKHAMAVLPEDDSLKLTYLSAESDPAVRQQFFYSIVNQYKSKGIDEYNLPSKIVYLKIWLLFQNYMSDKNERHLKEIEMHLSKLNKCEFLSWIRNAQEYAIENKDVVLLKYLSEQMNDYEAIHNSYEFQITFGDIQNSLDYFDDSIRHYKKALTYKTNHYRTFGAISYALLGKAVSQEQEQEQELALKTLSEAESYALRSLNLNRTSQITANYLESIFYQNKFLAYSKKFKYHSNYLKSQVPKEIWLGMLAHNGYALCKTLNLDDAQNILSEIMKSSYIHSDKLDTRIDELKSCIAQVY